MSSWCYLLVAWGSPLRGTPSFPLNEDPAARQQPLLELIASFFVVTK